MLSDAFHVYEPFLTGGVITALAVVKFAFVNATPSTASDMARW